MIEDVRIDIRTILPTNSRAISYGKFQEGCSISAERFKYRSLEIWLQINILFCAVRELKPHHKIFSSCGCYHSYRFHTIYSSGGIPLSSSFFRAANQFSINS